MGLSSRLVALTEVSQRSPRQMGSGQGIRKGLELNVCWRPAFLWNTGSVRTALADSSCLFGSGSVRFYLPLWFSTQCGQTKDACASLTASWIWLKSICYCMPSLTQPLCHKSCLCFSHWEMSCWTNLTPLEAILDLETLRYKRWDQVDVWNFVLFTSAAGHLTNKLSYWMK